MDVIKLSDINLLDIGSSIQIAGTVWCGLGLCFITSVPGKDEDFSLLKKMPLTLPEWETVLRQSDLLETEIISKDPTGKLVKIILRKTQRQIDTYLQWAAFQRDEYHCRYCWRTGLPLTVDHIDLWEEGGATVLENLISACRPCNKDRGRIHYEEWILSPKYIQKYTNVPEHIRKINYDLIAQLPHLKSLRVQHVRSR